MSGEHRQFLGKSDPNKILLESVFPMSDISFATPMHEEGRCRRLVVEGNVEHLAILGGHLEKLVKESPKERFFGRWFSLAPDGATDGLAIFYEPFEPLVNSIELLDLVLRRHLIQVCNLKLAEFSLLVATGYNFSLEVFPKSPKSELREFKERRQLPLPKEIGNGKIELPIIIFP